MFTLIGTLAVFQSYNGRTCFNQIVSSLKNLWPELKIVHSKPRYNQSQSNFVRVNQDRKHADYMNIRHRISILERNKRRCQ